jgi:hypothetical protein
MDEAQLKRELALKEEALKLEQKREELALREAKEQERIQAQRIKLDQAEEKEQELLGQKILSGTREKVGHGMSWIGDKIMIMMVILLISGTLFAGYSAYQWPAVREGIALQWDKMTSGIGSGARTYTNYLEQLDKEAKGDYASGVQEQSTQDFGLKIKSLSTYAPDNKFTAGQEYIIGGELTAQIPPEETQGNVTISCQTREDKLSGTVDVNNVSMVDVSSVGQGFACTLPSNTKTGSQYVDTYATFPFTTKAVKYLGMFDPRTFQQMSETERQKYTELKAVYSGGPAQIGIDLLSYPIMVSDQCSISSPQTDCLPRMQITIDRKGLDPETTGQFEKIKNLQIRLFDGIKLRACTQIKFTDEGNNTWTADTADLERLGVITEAFTMGCQLQIEDPNTLVPNKAKSSENQIGLIVDYDFQIKKSIQIVIRENTQQLPGTTGVPETVTVTGLPAEIYVKYKTPIDAASSTYGVRKALIIGVISQESKGNPRAVSSAGAAGLMQFMPDTARDQGLNVTSVTSRCIITDVSGCNYTSDERFNPEKSIDAGAKYLKQLINKYNDESLALAAYNWGPGNVDDHCQTSIGIQSCTLPTETQKYVPAVLAYSQEFEQETATV